MSCVAAGHDDGELVLREPGEVEGEARAALIKAEGEWNKASKGLRACALGSHCQSGGPKQQPTESGNHAQRSCSASWPWVQPTKTAVCSADRGLMCAMPWKAMRTDAEHPWFPGKTAAYATQRAWR